MSKTAAKPAPMPDAEKASTRARTLATREDYFVAKIAKVFEPAAGEDLWEVLFVGRYTGNTKAVIAGDPKDAQLPYRAWVREDGTGYVTEGW